MNSEVPLAYTVKQPAHNSSVGSTWDMHKQVHLFHSGPAILTQIWKSWRVIGLKLGLSQNLGDKLQPLFATSKQYNTQEAL